MAGDKKRSKTIVFLHPDLGIGGAERLVVDAAVGLQKRGHRVVIFTSHCDPAHCFDEARDGTLDVRVRGNTLVPASLLGRFSILCAILRQLHLIVHISLLTAELRSLTPDAFFVDQLSAGLPLLKTLSSAPIFFYCHFPDLLLVQGRSALWKRLYRIPFDFLEEWSMRSADAIAVNSAFTKSIVSRTWPSLAQHHPSTSSTPASTPPAHHHSPGDRTPPWSSAGIILSINRFERKKTSPSPSAPSPSSHPPAAAALKLLLAGGYDPRIPENVSYHAELVALAESLNLKPATAKTLVSALNAPQDTDVLFFAEMLLRSAKLLVYTPEDEHFGIVPLEAMLRGVPVLAADSGGPRETVVEGRRGG
ncbi:Alpha-1,3-mannosyltransferase-like protein [Collariella sp. IMI 366227]|nr:Alpha-1,3-mannosyltransferase-like protein [Collariella sp. IMI 366227]